jgi:putative restriction endonuclease
MPATYEFGEIVGNPVGTTYADREAAKNAGVHQVTRQGISGNRTDGANSIVVNGGYEDDVDLGDEIIYTGAGGNDPSTKKQIADQELTQLGNAGLVISEENAYPVRVIRGSRGADAHSPATGFRYDGLFRVTEHWAETGKSGFRIWRYRLLKLADDEAAPYVPAANLPAGTAKPIRAPGVIQRIVRNTKVSGGVKRVHDYMCQVCGTRLAVPVGDYAEGAHIRGLGRPHNGPDQPENVLCLCPNHHVLLDKGAIYIDDSFIVRSFEGTEIGPLALKPNHTVDVAHFKYHRESFGLPVSTHP